MKSKLYVKNLAFKTENIDLEKLFSEVGTVVSVDVKKDKISGRNKGFAFVEMKNQQDASAAVEKFDKCHFMGRTIKVNITKDTIR
jgi:RNA recognition motif-containing protein